MIDPTKWNRYFNCKPEDDKEIFIHNLQTNETGVCKGENFLKYCGHYGLNLDHVRWQYYVKLKDKQKMIDKIEGEKRCVINEFEITYFKEFKDKINEIIEAVNELSLRNDYADCDKQDTSKDFKTETFDFSEALKRMKDGKLFKRTSWTNAAKIYLENGKFKIRFEGNLGGDPYLFLYNHSDILANDWVEC